MKKVFRKSWVSYVPSVFGMAADGAFYGFVLTARSSWSTAVSRYFDLGGDIEVFIQKYDNEMWVGAVVLLGLIAVRIALHIISLRTHRVEITRDKLILQCGLLPWRKRRRTWTKEQVYDSRAAYYAGFLGWILRVGAVQIVGREGSTEKAVFSQIHRPAGADRVIRHFAGLD